MNSPESNSAAETRHFCLSRSKGLRGLAFSLVLLGFCVFGWGLRYKLSLYYPPHSINRHMPEAKLLSGKECATLVAVDLRRIASPEAPLAFSTVAFAFLLLLVSGPSMSRFRPRAAFADSGGAPQCVPRLASSIRPPPRRY